MPALLDARSLVKHLGGRRVVDGVDLACETSQIVGLLGPNGAGKTTTLRMLYGFLRPDAGRIHVERGGARARPGAGQARDRGVHPGRHVRRRLHGGAEPLHRGELLPPAADRSRPARGRAARALRPGALRAPEAGDALGRVPAPADDRARPRAPAAPALPRRAHHRPRPAGAHGRCGISSTACAPRASASS